MGTYLNSLFTEGYIFNYLSFYTPAQGGDMQSLLLYREPGTTQMEGDVFESGVYPGLGADLFVGLGRVRALFLEVFGLGATRLIDRGN